MCKKNGLRLLKQVKELTPCVPVLALAARGEIPTTVRAIQDGAIDVIPNPFRKAYFIQKVRSIIRQSRITPPDSVKALVPKGMSVLKLIVEARSDREIAETTNRRVKTIGAHRAGLVGKLGAQNVIEQLNTGAAIGLGVQPRNLTCDNGPKCTRRTSAGTASLG